jgi:hypothetical protein
LEKGDFDKNYSIAYAPILVTFAQKMKIFDKEGSFQKTFEIHAIAYATYAVVEFSRRWPKPSEARTSLVSTTPPPVIFIPKSSEAEPLQLKSR